MALKRDGVMWRGMGPGKWELRVVDGRISLLITGPLGEIELRLSFDEATELDSGLRTMLDRMLTGRE